MKYVVVCAFQREWKIEIEQNDTFKNLKEKISAHFLIPKDYLEIIGIPRELKDFEFIASRILNGQKLVVVVSSSFNPSFEFFKNNLTQAQFEAPRKFCSASLMQNPIEQPKFLFKSVPEEKEYPICGVCAASCRNRTRDLRSAKSESGELFICQCADIKGVSACQFQKLVPDSQVPHYKKFVDLIMKRALKVHIEKIEEQRKGEKRINSIAEQQLFLNRMYITLTALRRAELEETKAIALSVIPYDEIEEKIDEEQSSNPEINRRDELMHWFKQRFFKWVNSPECQRCGSETRPAGRGPPTEQERADLAGTIELFGCTSCGQVTRFPRYNDGRKLLATRRGRCGEWAKAFYTLSRALDYDVRFIHDMTDHVWVEVYSEEEERFIHADVCEDIWDCPFTYEVGWKKKLTYIFAMSNEEFVDVTRRYTKCYDDVVTRRTLFNEAWLQEKCAYLNNSLMSSLSDEKLVVVLSRQSNELMSFLADDNRVPKNDETRSRISGNE